MNSRISLLLPTRGRPKLVERLFESIVERTKNLSSIEVILYVDEDDHESHQLHSKVFTTKRIIGPCLSMGAYNTACYHEASGDIIILVNDDIVIRTHFWDDLVQKIDKKFDDKIYLGYANDLFKTQRFCTFPIMSRRTCELLIDPYPIDYHRTFIDVHLFDVFKRLSHLGNNRILYDPNLIFEHLHFRTGKAELDSVYNYTKERRFADDENFIRLSTMRSLSARRLKDAISRNVELDIKRDLVHQAIPSNYFHAFIYFSRKFLFDLELPFRWRFFLWYWFFGRYLAANGFFHPFSRG